MMRKPKKYMRLDASNFYFGKLVYSSLKKTKGRKKIIICATTF